MTSNWATRYPDLGGKTVIVAGESGRLIEVARAFAGNHSMLAVVAPDRGVVASVLDLAEQSQVDAFGFTGDPSSPALWARIAPHIEQRLGPIDIAVLIAPSPARQVIVDAVLPDMTARHRGVLIEIGLDVSRRRTSDGVRHRAIDTADDPIGADLAAAALLCASDTMAATSVRIALGQPPG